MSAVERRVQGRRPAQVINARPVPRAEIQPVEVWTDTRWALAARVKTAVKRREVAEAGGWKAVAGAPGWYSVEVRRLRQPEPRWKRLLPAVLAGVGFAFLAVLGIGWAVATVVAAAGVALASVPTAVWFVLVALLLAGGGSATTVIVKVIVR